MFYIRLKYLSIFRSTSCKIYEGNFIQVRLFHFTVLLIVFNKR